MGQLYPPAGPRKGETPEEQYVDRSGVVPPGISDGDNWRNVQRAPVNFNRRGDDKFEMSSADMIRLQGFRPDAVAKRGVGEPLWDIYGEAYIITEKTKTEVKIKSYEDETRTGVIYIAPMKMPGKKYTFTLGDSVGQSKKLEVHDMAFNHDDSLKTSDFINNLVRAIPAQHFGSVDVIRIHRENGERDGCFREPAGFFTSQKVIDIYVNPDHDSNPFWAALQTLYHELGHGIASSICGDVNPGPKWRQAMESDANNISEYSAKTRYERPKGKPHDHGEIEDFAETVRLYLRTDGAKASNCSALRAACRYRFAILDELFGNSVYQSQVGTWQRLNRFFGKQVKTPLD